MFLQRSDQKPTGLGEPQPAVAASLMAQQALRLLVLAPIVLLALVMLLAASTGLVENSISAYHGGPFRDVFVGALLATAVGLVAYWGVTPLEDFAFNLAGFFAVFVAFVPFDVKSQILGAAEGPFDARSVVKATLLAFFLTVAAFIIVDASRGRWSVGWLMGRRRDRLVAWASIAMLAGYSLWVAICLLDSVTTFPGVHLTAAVFLFVQLWIAVAGQAWFEAPADSPAPRVTGKLRIWYRVIAVLMALAAVGAAGLAALGQAPAQLVLEIELVEITLFAVFWTSELVRFWNVPGPDGGQARVSR